MHEHFGRPLAVVVDVAGVGFLVDLSLVHYLPEVIATLGSAAALICYSIQIWDRWKSGPRH